MPDEFSIGGSFGGSSSSYNPFDSGFGALATSAAGGGGSLDPSLLGGGSTPTTTSAASSNNSSSSSSGSGWGGVVGNLLNTGANWLGGVLTLDFLGRAQDKGLAGGSTQQNTSTNTTQTPAPSASSGLPSWAIPAGIGGFVLLILLIVLMRK